MNERMTEKFINNSDLLQESLSELILCDAQEAVELWVKDWLRLRELEAQIKRVDVLPDAWRKVHCGEQRCRDTFDGCADELQAALEQGE